MPVPAFVHMLAGGPAVSSFVPTSISGCQIWLDADDAATFTFGTGVQVATWTDKSANGFVFSRTASTAIQRNGTRNSRTTVDVSAAGKLAVTPGTAICANAISAFAVFIKKGTAQSFESYPITFSASNQPRNLDAWNQTRLHGAAAAYNQAATNLSTQTTFCQMVELVQVSGQSYAEYKDGTVVVSGTSANITSNTTSQVLTVASRSDSATQLIGEIAEIIVYDTSLGTTDRQTVEGYLRTKWGTP